MSACGKEDGARVKGRKRSKEEQGTRKEEERRMEKVWKGEGRGSGKRETGLKRDEEERKEEKLKRKEGWI